MQLSSLAMLSWRSITYQAPQLALLVQKRGNPAGGRPQREADGYRRERSRASSLQDPSSKHPVLLSECYRIGARIGTFRSMRGTVSRAHGEGCADQQGRQEAKMEESEIFKSDGLDVSTTASEAIS